MDKRVLLPILLICFIAIAFGCVTDKTNQATGQASPLPSDKYVAIDEYLATNATVTNGSYDGLPHITPPVFYDYDGSVSGDNPASGSSWENATAYISDLYYPAVNTSFKALYGTVYYHDVAPMDTRTGVRVRGIYGYPYVLESGIVISDIDSNGTIFGSYHNTTITLRSGEHWTTPALVDMKSSRNTGGNQSSYTAAFNTTWTITNLGVVDKSRLTGYNNSLTDEGFSQVNVGADPRAE